MRFNSGTHAGAPVGGWGELHLLGVKRAGAALAGPARDGSWGLRGGRGAHLLLPPLQGGEVEDPEVASDTPSCESPQKVHGTTASRHVGSRMEGAG